MPTTSQHFPAAFSLRMLFVEGCKSAGGISGSAMFLFEQWVFKQVHSFIMACLSGVQLWHAALESTNDSERYFVKWLIEDYIDPAITTKD